MTHGPNRILDDLAKLMTDAAGAAQGARREAETALRAQAERFLGDMDLVKRDEFEAFKELAANLKLENNALKEQLDSLTERVEALEGDKKPATRAASKTTSKAAGKTASKSPRAKKTG